jgi:hypothetical protein
MIALGAGIQRLVAATMMTCALVAICAGPAQAQHLDREGATSVLTIQKSDPPPWGQPLRLHIAPDLYGAGWFACDTCGEPIPSGQLIIRLEQPIHIVIDDPGRMAVDGTRLSIRVEAVSPHAADGTGLELNFDRGDVVRDDTLVVHGRAFDVGGDGTTDIDLTDIHLRSTSVWMGPGNDVLDGRHAISILDALPFGEKTHSASLDESRLNMGAGNDVVHAPERIAPRIDLGPGDDQAHIGTDLDARINLPQMLTFSVAMSGGRDVVDAMGWTRALQVTSNVLGGTEKVVGGSARIIYGGRQNLTVVSTTDDTAVTAMRSAAAEVYVTSRRSVVRTGAGRDKVQIYSSSSRLAMADINTGAGNDGVSLFGVRARGTTGAGSDVVAVAHSGMSELFDYAFRGTDTHRFSCGSGQDQLLSATSSSASDGTHPDPVQHAVRSCEIRGTDREASLDQRVAWSGWVLSAYETSRSYIGYGSFAQPTDEASQVQIVSADPAQVVVRPSPSQRQLEFTATVQGGQARWRCAQCPEIPVTGRVVVQSQHPSQITVRVPANLEVAPIEIHGLGRRAHWSRDEVGVTGAAAVTVVGNDVRDHGHLVVTYTGVLPMEVKISTGVARDVVDLSAARPPIAWHVDSGRGADMLTGSPFDDELVSSGAARMDGMGGADFLLMQGAGTADGGGGDDTIEARNPGASLYGGRGNDTLSSSHGSRIMRGGPGDDTLKSERGTDRLFGDDGDDKLTKTRTHGKVSMFGGAGNDVLQSRESVPVIAADCGGGRDAALLYGVHQKIGASARGCELLAPKRDYFWQYVKWHQDLGGSPYGEQRSLAERHRHVSYYDLVADANDPLS